jgi:ribosomal-protein-serine acetyltransferase
MDGNALITFDLGDGHILRPFHAGDAEAVFTAVMANYNHLREYMHWMVPNYSLDHAKEFIASSIEATANKQSLGFGIFIGTELIGSIGFVHFDHAARRTEIGYWIDKSHEGKGIVSRSCRRLIDYAFGELQMNRVEIRCSTENVRSAAIPVRFGFTREGTLRQSEVRNGRMHDFAIYGLLASEWSAKMRVDDID